MKRVSLAALAALALIVAAGCQDAVTSPQLGPDASLRYGPSNPPPPPIETSASGSFCCAPEPVVTQQSPGLGQMFSLQRSSGFRPRFSFQGSSLRGPALDVQPQQVVCFFSIPVRYMFNNESNAGYVHFSSDPDNDVNASSNGMVKFAHSDFSGAGTLEIVTTCGLVVIDLSSVNGESSNFNEFSFNLFFDDALLFECGNTEDCDGIEGSAEMSGFVGEG